ncbi:MAG: helix-turn-helix domain-containing protein [Acetatifactor sp.]
MENLSIGTRIKQRRKELGLTQVQIKQETGISSGNMSEIENGNKLPSAPALISLSTILDCSIDWMLKGEAPKRESPFLSDEREMQLLEGFRQLSEDDKDELFEIMKLKLRKRKIVPEINVAL